MTLQPQAAVPSKIRRPLYGLRFLTRRKLLCATLAWMAGLAAGRLTPFHPAYLAAAAGGVGLWILFRRSAWGWIFSLAVFAFAGLAWCALRMQVPAFPGEGNWTVRGRVEGTVTVREDAARLDLSHLWIQTETGWTPQKGRAYAWVQDASAFSLRHGDEITLTGKWMLPQEQRNPGGFDQRMWLLQNGNHFMILSRTPVDVLKPARVSWTGVLFAFGEHLYGRMDALFGDMSPLFRGMLLGERTLIPETWNDDFARAGIIHLLSVSGLHVGFLYGMAALLLKRLGPGPWTSLGILCLLLGLYAVLTGLVSSILRASLMFAALALGKALGRKADPVTCLAAAALAILLVRPFDLFSAGFQMSFGAVLGLILLTRPLEKAFQWLPRKIAQPVVLSFAAQAGAWIPMIACYGWVSWISPLTNLVAVPLSSLLFPFTVPVLLIDALWPGLAKILAWVPYGVMRLLYALANWTGSANLTLRIPAATTPLLAAGFYLTLFLASNAVKLRTAVRAACGAVLLAAGIASVAWTLSPTRYVQLDVGQASAGVLLAQRRCVVYDTGKDGTELVDLLMYTGEDVDILFLSHAHADHAGGLEALLDARVRIGRIVVAACDGGKDPDPSVAPLLLRAQAQGIRLETVAQGDALELTPQISAQILWPPRGHACGNTNDCSLVVRVAAGAHSLLWTGDISDSAEPLRGVDCDVLQVAHHGSVHATGAAFLRQATPAVALVSSGKGNAYGHPAPALLERLEMAGATTFRTDQSGALTVYLDQPELIVRTYCEGSQ